MFGDHDSAIGGDEIARENKNAERCYMYGAAVMWENSARHLGGLGHCDKAPASPSQLRESRTGRYKMYAFCAIAASKLQRWEKEQVNEYATSYFG